MTPFERARYLADALAPLMAALRSRLTAQRVHDVADELLQPPWGVDRDCVVSAGRRVRLRRAANDGYGWTNVLEAIVVLAADLGVPALPADDGRREVVLAAAAGLLLAGLVDPAEDA